MVGSIRSEVVPPQELRPKRLRTLEDENRRLNQIVADQGLDIAILKDVAGRKS